MTIPFSLPSAFINCYGKFIIIIVVDHFISFICISHVGHIFSGEIAHLGAGYVPDTRASIVEIFFIKFLSLDLKI